MLQFTTPSGGEIRFIATDSDFGAVCTWDFVDFTAENLDEISNQEITWAKIQSDFDTLNEFHFSGLLYKLFRHSAIYKLFSAAEDLRTEKRIAIFLDINREWAKLSSTTLAAIADLIAQIEARLNPPIEEVIEGEEPF